MISEAITSLKERTGSSQYAIAKFLEDKHKDKLPSNFRKMLLVQLKKLAAAGKLTKVKNSYKVPSGRAPAADKPKPKAKAKKAASDDEDEDEDTPLTKKSKQSKKVVKNEDEDEDET